jgi:hypothetical protein
MVSCAGREGFLEVSEMSVFNFLKQDANLLARVEVLETRVAILEGMVRSLTIDKNVDDFIKENKQTVNLELRREYARKYYQANKEAIKARKRDKRPVVSPNQLELPSMAVGGTS